MTCPACGSPVWIPGHACTACLMHDNARLQRAREEARQAGVPHPVDMTAEERFPEGAGAGRSRDD